MSSNYYEEKKMFSLFTLLERYRSYYSMFIYRLISILSKLIRIRTKYTRLELIGLIIFIGLLLNIFSLHYFFQCSSLTNHEKSLSFISKSKDSNNNPISTIERSRKASFFQMPYG
ncbi:unnamed protein product, partial [Rotaria sordida]